VGLGHARFVALQPDDRLASGAISVLAWAQGLAA
jgi:hypothetical protein